MSQPITWTARTVAEANDLLDAVKDRIESGMKAAHPGRGFGAREKAGKTTPLLLSITFDTSTLDQVANERSVFDDQISPLDLPDQA